MTDVGTRFVEALAAKDSRTLVGLFAADVDFRGMTPSRFWESRSPQDVVDNVLYRWFEPDEIVEKIEHVEIGTVVDRDRVDYRFLVRTADGVFRVEQRGYFDPDDEGKIAKMHVMCSGFRQLDATEAG